MAWLYRGLNFYLNWLVWLIVRTFVVLLLLLNIAYLAWNFGLVGEGKSEPVIVRGAALHAAESLQLLSEALLEGVELKELVSEVCIEPDYALDELQETSEMQTEEKQQEKLCETIAPESEFP